MCFCHQGGPSATMRQQKSHYIGLLCLVFVSALSNAANFDEPHQHKGVLDPYEARALQLNLSQDQLNSLRSGNSIMIQMAEGQTKRGVMIQDVNAPPSVVMGRILDFGSYTRMVPKVTECRNYFEGPGMDGNYQVI